MSTAAKTMAILGGIALAGAILTTHNVNADFKYTVKYGDSWSSIASRNNIKTSELLSANGKSYNSMLYAGTTITIPEDGELAPPPFECLMMNTFTLDASDIITDGVVDDFFDNNEPYFMYTPVYGDTWYKIANKFKCPVNELLDLNNANLSTMIYAGVDIKVYSKYDDPEYFKHHKEEEMTNPPMPELIETQPVTQGTTDPVEDLTNPPMPTEPTQTTVQPTTDPTEPSTEELTNPTMPTDAPEVPTEPKVERPTEHITAPPATLGYANGVKTYYPVTGDGWYKIANKFNMNVNTILAFNCATLNTTVYVGKPVYIPVGYNIVSSNTKTENKDSTYLGGKSLYNTPGTDSWKNITHAADLLNGFTLAPGEVFSWIDYPAFSHQCGYEDGFIDARVFISPTQVGIAPGGGICFVSTVTYQAAVLECGMEKIERYNHSQKVSYAVPGEDAAINLTGNRSTSKNMSFRNTTGHTVRFDYKYTSNGKLTVSVYAID